LLHAAAHHGHIEIVDELLARGMSPNVRESGDNTLPAHWAAAAGHLDVVRRLADAGSDLIGDGDDHQLQVIGWATCWDGCDDAPHHAVADFLVSRGAKHHIFSAIAMNLGDVVSQIIASDASALNRRMSRNENHQTPLQFAVRMNRPSMVSLLLEHGADPLTVDGEGQPVATYASNQNIDKPVMQAIRRMTLSELESAARGKRKSRCGTLDLVAALALRDTNSAETIVRDNADLLNNGALHLLAKRGDASAVQWLVDHGANPNSLWAHWDADVTPLHMCVWSDDVELARVLIEAGADQSIRDSKHEGTPAEWAEHFGKPALRRVLIDAQVKKDEREPG
jgi:ankyrin repeat protein